MEAEWSDASTSQGLLGATRSWERGLSLKASRKAPTVPTPGLWTSDLQNCEKIDVCCFKPPVCGDSLQQPWETKTSSSCEEQRQSTEAEINMLLGGLEEADSR